MQTTGKMYRRRRWRVCVNYGVNNIELSFFGACNRCHFRRMKSHVCSAILRQHYTLPPPASISFMWFYDFIFFWDRFYLSASLMRPENTVGARNRAIRLYDGFTQNIFHVVRKSQKWCDEIEFSQWNHIFRRRNGNAKQYQRLTPKWRRFFLWWPFFSLSQSFVLIKNWPKPKSLCFGMRNERENWVKQHAAKSEHSWCATYIPLCKCNFSCCDKFCCAQCFATWTEMLVLRVGVRICAHSRS